MAQTYLRPEIQDLGTLADITLGNGSQLTDIAGIGLEGGIAGSVTNPTTPITIPGLNL